MGLVVTNLASSVTLPLATSRIYFQEMHKLVICTICNLYFTILFICIYLCSSNSLPVFNSSTLTT